MRILLLGLLLVVGSPAQAAPTWVWHKACTADAAITQCDVWFNSLEPSDALALRIGDEAREITVRTYTELEIPSTNAILLHLPGLNRDERRSIRGGLSAFVTSSTAFQNIGVFASGAEGMQSIGFPGADRDDLQQAVSGWRSESTAKDPVGDLGQVLEILGGNPTERKVVYWITSGLQMTDAQVGAIEAAAAGQDVRIIVLHLVRTELDINSSPALRQLGEQAHGFYDFKNADDWQASLGALSVYGLNGARLTFEGADLCGDVPATFTASLGGEVIEQSETISFGSCGSQGQGEAQEEDREEAEAETESDAEPDEEVPDADTPSEEPVADGEAEDGSTPADETGDAEDEPAPVGEAEDETAPAGDESETPVEPGVPADNTPVEQGLTTIQIGLMAGLGLLVVIVLVLMARNKKKAEPLVEEEPVIEAQPDVESEPVKSAEAVGFLEFERSGAYERHPIDQETVQIGRSDDNDVVIKDDTVSGFHAVIKIERNGDVLLVDLNSTNCTFVNDEEITQRVLQSGDQLKFGSQHVVYQSK